MNTAQRYALLVAAANLVLVLLFPPYDYVSMLLGNVPTFDGFYFVLSGEPHRVVNANFLALELFVLLANAGIAWLLLRTPDTSASSPSSGNRRQRAVLGLVAINLIVAVLFPPFENFAAITRAALPTFEGFHFIFGDNPMRQIVASILYIEMALILVNGGLLWLLFRDKTADELSAEQMRDLADKIKATPKK
ncbi:MAG: hypothetical protein HZB40_05980 [Rhodocyclales bacterium]|nr:hypothetical protein [Rhodocyclales bacterium]